MNLKIATLAGAAALSLMAGAAQATVTFNADLAGPGFYSGSGIDNGHFAINTVDGIELGVRGRQGPNGPGGADALQAAAPINGTDLYRVATGHNISVDFSFNPGADGSPASTAGLFSNLTITNLGTGQSASFNPYSLLPDNDTDPGAPGGFQNSERFSFAFLNGAVPGLGNIGYNNLASTSYRVDFSVGGSDFATISQSIFIDQGAGVPEPASWALMIAGFGFAGASLRRRRAAAAL